MCFSSLKILKTPSTTTTMPVFTINHDILEVNPFQYLGSILTENCSTDFELPFFTEFWESISYIKDNAYDDEIKGVLMLKILLRFSRLLFIVTSGISGPLLGTTLRSSQAE